MKNWWKRKRTIIKDRKKLKERKMQSLKNKVRNNNKLRKIKSLKLRNKMIVNSKKRIRAKIKRKIRKLQKIMKTQNPNPKRILKSKTKRIIKAHKRPHKIFSTSARLQSSLKTVIGLVGESHLPSKEMTSRPKKILTYQLFYTASSHKIKNCL